MHDITIGTVYRCAKNGKQVFVCDIHYTDESNKRKVISTSGASKRDVASRARKKYETLICKTKSTAVSDVTFESYATHWLNEVYKGTVQENSWERVEQVIRLELIPYLGDMYMSEIRQVHVQNMLKHFSELNHAPTCLKKYRSAVKMIFKHYRAENNNYCAPNPAEDVRIPATAKTAAPKSEICFSPEQLDAIAESATATYRNGRPIFRLGYALIFMMFTGLRPSEMLGLCWSDIAEDFSRININHVVITEKHKPVLKDGTKSKCSRRTIMLCEAAQLALNQLQKITGNDLTVMSTQKHTLVAYCDFNRTFHRVLKRAGIELKPNTCIGPHSFRHNFATNMAKNNIAPEIISSILGHSSVVCTLDHYVHPDAERKLKATEDLATFMSINLPMDDDDVYEGENTYFEFNSQ